MKKRDFRCFSEAKGISGLTARYLDIMRKALLRAGFSFSRDARPRRSMLLLEDELIPAFKRMITGYRHCAIWVQGIVPEESFLRNGSALRRAVLSAMERYVLRRAEFVFFCSDAMQRHYEEKYALSFAGRSFRMPCFDTDTVSEDAFSSEKYESLTFAYVGSLSAWQCFSETAALYRRIEQACGNRSRFFVFTAETERAARILHDFGVQNAEVCFLTGDALLAKLAHIRYGFALRRRNEVNRVATPTKLALYLSCGMIPIFSPVLEDFTAHMPPSLGIRTDAEASTLLPILRDMETPTSASEMRRLCAFAFSNYYSEALYLPDAASACSLRFATAVRPEKRLLFLVNRMETGGIPRALCALLREICDDYAIDLFAVSGGAEMAELPCGIRILPVPPLVAATEIPLSRLKLLPPPVAAARFFMALWTKLFGKHLPFFCIGASVCGTWEEYDAVISFCQPLADRCFGNICHSLALSVPAERHLTFLHGDFARYGGNTAENRRLYRGYDRICAVSEATAETFRHAVPALAARVCVVPNFVDAARVRRLAAEDPVSLGIHPAIVSVCRLSPEKGLRRVLPMLSRLRAQGASFCWYIVGDGILRESLLTDIETYRLKDRVILLGERKNPYGVMAAADFLLLPSFHEAAPLVVSEAVSLSLPVLATDVGGVRALVGNFGHVCGAEDGALERALAHFVLEGAYSAYRTASPPAMCPVAERFSEALSAPARKIRLSRRIETLPLACLALALLLVLRDFGGLPLGKLPFCLLTAFSLLPMDSRQARLYTCFLLPLLSALPSNYMVVLLLGKYLSLSLARGTAYRVPRTLGVAGLLSALYLLLQAGLSDGSLFQAASFGAELLLLVFLLSDRAPLAPLAMARLYGAAVLLLGALSLATGISENGAAAIFSGAVRFGDIYEESTAIRAAVDPNFLGFFCLTGIAAYAALRRRSLCGRAEAVFFFLSLGFLGFVGLSRSFFICLAVLIAAETLAHAKTPRGLLSFLRGAVCLFVPILLLLRLLFSSLADTLLSRFSASSLAGAGGRVELITDWLSRFLQTGKTLLVGVGWQEINVHMTFLQIFFGLGLVGAPLFLAFTALLARQSGYRPLARGARAMTAALLLMSATIPAARSLAAYFPLVIAVLFGASLQIQSSSEETHEA